MIQITNQNMTRFVKGNSFRFLLMVVFLLSSVMMKAETASSSKAKQEFAPFPTASDKYWRKQVPMEMRNDYIHLGEQYLGKPWEAIPDSVFAEFRTNGNRTHYEALSFGIRTQFACLVMAEIMEGRGRFLPSIRKGLHYFMEKEPWWGIPAHYPKSRPERKTQPVDLFNAETASMLSWTLYMIGAQIDKKERGLCDSVRSEITYRFLHPTLYNKQGWKANANNWNTWITTNWLQTALICWGNELKNNKNQGNELKNNNILGSAEELRKTFEGIKQCMRTFLKGYPDDGGCEEGVGYWDCAGGSFFESLYFMQFAPTGTQGKLSSSNAKCGLSIIDVQLQLDEAQREKVAAMGRFITSMYVDDLNFVNFSDAQAHNVPNINILFPYGAYLHDEPMMQLAAYVAEKYHYMEHPSTLFLKSGNYPKLGRELMLLSMLDKLRATKAVQPHTKDAYLANSQIMVASNEDWLVAAKGGNNAESHNHNDIGNFIVYHHAQPVIIDLGRDTYTSQSFGNRRFELMNCRSAYHNVPLINGCEQKDGSAYRAHQVSHIFNDSLSSIAMNLEKAYPVDAHVEAWRRTISLDRAKSEVRIEENFQMDAASSQESESQSASSKMTGCQSSATQIVLMTFGKPILASSGRILLQEGNAALEYDAHQLTASVEKVQMADGIMKTQWKDNVYRITLQRKDEKLVDGKQVDGKQVDGKTNLAYRFINIH